MFAKKEITKNPVKMQKQPAKKIAFIDLQAQKIRLGNRVEEAVLRVLEHGHYIMGPEVFTLEKSLSEFCGAKHTITCANGTDALMLILMAKEVKAKDAIFVPSFTFAATAEVVALLGATPIFVDVLPNTYNIDPNSLEEGVKTAKKLGLHPKGVFAVDLYGQPADYDLLQNVCHSFNIELWADAAQSFGAEYKGIKVGTFGECTATSFYPAKPLGCFGDGGAVFTNDDALAEILISLRVHGQGHHKYDNVRIGMNGRMDTIQAAILIEKLSIFSEEISKRQAIAARYTTLINSTLMGLIDTPYILPETKSIFAQYTILLKQNYRESIIKTMTAHDIPTAVHYPKTLHQQPAYQHYPTAGQKDLPVSEDLASRVLSLPMHPYLSPQCQEKIVQVLQESCKKTAAQFQEVE